MIGAGPLYSHITDKVLDIVLFTTFDDILEV
jgi:hypothetical protein